MRRTKGNLIIHLAILAGDFVILNIILWLFVREKSLILPNYLVENSKLTYFVANVAMLISQTYFSSVLQRRFVGIRKMLVNTFKLVATQVILEYFFLRLLSNLGSFFESMVSFFAIEWVAIIVIRFIEIGMLKYLRRHGRNRRSTILVGDDPSLLILYKDMLWDSFTGFNVRGYYANKEIENCPEELQYLGTIDDLMRLVREMPSPMGELSASLSPEEQKKARELATANDIFCSMSHDYSPKIVELLKFCEHNLVHFFYLPRTFGYYRLNLHPVEIGSQMAYVDLREPLEQPLNRAEKRIFDVVVSFAVCLCLLPFIPIIGLIIKLQSPGPIFFKQKRTGFNGKVFECYKFRSMHVNKSADSLQATKDDPRKFPFGNFMRKTNIDEFPQFFNVLRGDMSIVGPRPHMLKHTEIYGKLIDKYMMRHFCKPGITGFAQVTGYRGETKELWQMEERVRRDIWYIEHWSFLLDLEVILRTFISIFRPDKEAY